MLRETRNLFFIELGFVIAPDEQERNTNRKNRLFEGRSAKRSLFGVAFLLYYEFSSSRAGASCQRLSSLPGPARSSDTVVPYIPDAADWWLEKKTKGQP